MRKKKKVKHMKNRDMKKNLIFFLKIKRNKILLKNVIFKSLYMIKEFRG